MFYPGMDELTYATHATDLILVQEEFDVVIAQLGIEKIEHRCMLNRLTVFNDMPSPESSLILMQVGQRGHSILRIELARAPVSKAYLSLRGFAHVAQSIWTSSITAPPPTILHGPKAVLDKLVRRLVAAEQAATAGDVIKDPMVAGVKRTVEYARGALEFTGMDGAGPDALTGTLTGYGACTWGAPTHFGANIALRYDHDAGALTINPPQVYAPTTPAPQA